MKTPGAASRIGLGLATLVVGLTAASTAVAGSTDHGIVGSKSKNGPFTSVGEMTIADGKTKVIYWRVINPEGIDQEMSLDDSFTEWSESNYKLSWYEGAKQKASKKITQQVAGGGSGFDFTLDAGDTKVFSTKVKAINATSLCVIAQATSSTSANIRSAFFGVNNDCV